MKILNLSSGHRDGMGTGRLFGALIVCLILTLVLVTPACKKKEKTAGTTTIRFVTWKPNQPAVWDGIIKAFEAENPGIRVERETGPHSSTGFHDLLTQKLKNKSPDVDVFFMDVIWPSEFAAAGWAMPLDSYFPKKEQGKFLNGTVIANTYKGHIYGVPVFIDSGMLYYRKDLLEKYGFKPPGTWEEMVSQAKKITAGEASNMKMDGFSGQFKQYEGLVCNMMEYILSNGGHIVDPDTGQPEIAAKPAVEAVRFVRDKIIGNVAPQGELTYEEPESLALFIQGKAVFHRNWPYAWEVSNDPARSRVAGKVGIAKLPHFPGGKSYSTLGGWQLAISSYSKNKEAAWTFIRFLTSRKIQKQLAVQAGFAPTRKALYGDADVLKANPQFRSMKDVFVTAYPRPRSPLYPAISNILQRYFSSAISDRDSNVEGEALRASKEMKKIISLAQEEGSLH
ncbi:MAG: ABC transporter substrate-binding protein [Candidatus Sulfobium sp.]|jgi:multiple sugar transport system substrate-binding protein